jgi:glucokinase
VILTGDVGGTKTLLALHDDAGAIVDRRLFSSHESSAFGDLVARFLDGAAARPRAACFGIAGPVIGDRVKVTHLPWEIDAGALAARFGLRRVRLLNDFAAAAHGIAALGPGDLVTLQAGEPIPERPKVVLGAGTGLGLAYMLDDAVLSGEAGHASFAPADAAQGALWQWLQRRHGRVHVEQVVSGAGLVEIDDFLRGPQPGPSGDSEPPDRAATIAHAALVDGDAQALAAVDLFLACFGALAGDHALTVLARGGVYLAGGIAPKLLPRMLAGGFITAFNEKGTFSAWTRTCPVHVVINTDLPLLGAARVAQRDVG